MDLHLQRLRKCQRTDQETHSSRRTFPSEKSLLRPVTGVLIEISETWDTTKAYLKFN